MNRLPALTVAFVLLVAGCAAPATPAGDAGGTTTTETTTATTTTAVTPDATLSSKPLPDPPANLTGDRAGRFAARYEESYLWNLRLDDATAALGVHATVESTNRTRSGYVVRLGGSFHETFVRDEGAALHADGVVQAAYFVNGTVVMRAQASADRPRPDPRNGTVVERIGANAGD